MSERIHMVGKETSIFVTEDTRQLHKYTITHTPTYTHTHTQILMVDIIRGNISEAEKNKMSIILLLISNTK